MPGNSACVIINADQDKKLSAYFLLIDTYFPLTR